MTYTALFDANVLYPAPLRDLLLQLSITNQFRAKWSADIHREWIEALLRNDLHRSRADLEKTRGLMDKAVRDCLVTGYEKLIASLDLPDPDDRHVLAAAIVGRCDVIVTQNLSDFPDKQLHLFGIEAQHPDEFMCNLLGLVPGIFCDAVRKVRARLKNPPYTAKEYLENLTQVGLVATASELEQFMGLV